MKRISTVSLILALQILILVNQWFGPSTSPAVAQIPDAGAQNAQIIDQLKQTNAKLDKLLDVLQSGKLQVTVAKPDEK
jgi:cell division protein FtsB